MKKLVVYVRIWPSLFEYENCIKDEQLSSSKLSLSRQWFDLLSVVVDKNDGL